MYLIIKLTHVQVLKIVQNKCKLFMAKARKEGKPKRNRKNWVKNNKRIQNNFIELNKAKNS